MRDPCVQESENGTILDPSGRVRLGLSLTTAGSWDDPWPIRLVEKTRSDTRPHGLPVGSGTGVAAHPVAQLAEQVIPARPLLQTTHRPHPPRTRTFHTIYNLSGALTQETYPSGRVVKNDFESDGDLQDVVSKKAGGTVFTPYVSDFMYTASGGISQMKLGNGRWESAVFNTRLQVTDLGLGGSATDSSLWKTHYDYGELSQDGSTVDATQNSGNIARQTLTVPGTSFTQNYRYDALYRLTEAKETTGTNQNWIQNWNYDRYGNRLSFTKNVAGDTLAPNPSVDPNTNRFNTGQGFTYDKNGNVVNDVDPITSLDRSFVFNADNKQIAVDDDNGNPIGQYFYDGEGKRVKKVTGTETTVFVYSSGKLVAEYSTQLSPSPSINYTTTDHLGSPRIITDALGQVKSRRDFMPFGEDINVSVGNRNATGLQYSTPTDPVRQKFTGYQKDAETSLDFAEARMYANEFGRFTAVDPLLASGKSASPQTFNRYAYVSNNPFAATDPLGLDPWWRKAIPDSSRYDYQESKESPGEGWEQVDFQGMQYLTVANWGEAGSGQTAYLYANGGQDFGLRARVAQSLTEDERLANSFNDPKLLAIRHPEVAEQGGAVMSMGVPFLNIIPGTYNLGAWGANRFGANLSYAPTLEPDENTPGISKFFYYGTNTVLAVEGGFSLYRGARNLFASGTLGTFEAANQMQFAVIGRRTATGTFATMKNSEILNIPKAAWSEERNASWIQSIANRRLPVQLASPLTRQELFHPNGALTQFGKEYQQLRQLGYYRYGNNFLFPQN